MDDVTSSIKPEVHYVSQSRQQSKIEPQPQGDLHTKFRQDQSSGSKDTLTDRQTHTQTDKLIATLRSPTGTE